MGNTSSSIESYLRERERQKENQKDLRRHQEEQQQPIPIPKVVLADSLVVGVKHRTPQNHVSQHRPSRRHHVDSKFVVFDIPVSPELVDDALLHATSGLELYPRRHQGATKGEAEELLLMKFSQFNTYYLNLNHIGLRELSGTAFSQAVLLRGLKLVGNMLSSIPAQLSSLRHLHRLDFSYNQLTSLPDSLCDLACLMELKLSHNCLTSLPPNLAGLAKLEILDLSHNQLTQLPQNVSELKSLLEIRLDHNPLTTVPIELSQLMILRILSVGGCPLLTELPQCSAPVLPSPLVGLATTTTPAGSLLDITNSLNAEAATLESEPAPVAPRLPSLKELAARVLVRHSVPVPPNSVPEEIAGYLKTAHTCSFCQGPFFEFEVKRYRFIHRGRVTLPQESRLCSAHYDTEKERIFAMFRPVPSTSPKTLDPEKLRLISAQNSRLGPTDRVPQPSKKATLLTRAGNLMKGKGSTTMASTSESEVSSSSSVKSRPSASSIERALMFSADHQIRAMKNSNSSLL